MRTRLDWALMVGGGLLVAALTMLAGALDFVRANLPLTRVTLTASVENPASLRVIEKNGGGSMTLLSIANTLQGDISGFIPTNLISMSDGQIYLNATLFGEGFKPAVDLGLSVSRIGTKIQPKSLRELAKNLGILKGSAMSRVIDNGSAKLDAVAGRVIGAA